jgi:hypothetical protein
MFDIESVHSHIFILLPISRVHMQNINTDEL